MDRGNESHEPHEDDAAPVTLTVDDLVRMSVESSSDLEQQKKRLHELFDLHPHLFDPSEARRVYVSELIATRRHTVLRPLKMSGIPTPNPSRRTLAAIASTSHVMAQTILDAWHLPLGPLGDYTAEMLIPLATQESERAAGHERNATFFQLLAGRLQSGQKVRHHFTPEAAWDLWEKISEVRKVPKKPAKLKRSA